MRRALNVLLRTERASEIPVVTKVTRHVVTTEVSEQVRGREGVATEREGGRRSYAERVETERVRERKSFEVLKVLRRGDIFLHFK
jgi:hypothetical protein